MDLLEIRRLFVEYARWLKMDLCFQDFENELRTLPGDYTPPTGSLWLATREDKSVGCVGLRQLQPHIGEVKRLYTVPSSRRLGIGRALMANAICTARSFGFDRLRLDTLPKMHAARRLYQSLGFRPIDPYYSNPIPGVVYLELLLDAPSPTAL